MITNVFIRDDILGAYELQLKDSQKAQDWIDYYKKANKEANQ